MNFFENAKEALLLARQTVTAMGQGLATRVESGGRLSRQKLDAIQPEAFRFAHVLAAVEAAEASIRFADRPERTFEQQLAAVFVARTVRQISELLLFDALSYGLKDAHPLGDFFPFVSNMLSTETLQQIGLQLFERSSEFSGAGGLNEEHQMIRQMFAQFSDEQLEPLAEEIHRKDDILPESLLKAYSELGVFGISIPEEYDGSMQDHLSMILATEELSRGSLGAGGSVITRPEICAKALLKGGSEEQKRYWLPKIARGEKIVSVAVTEPNAGSDVAQLRLSARKVEGGYLLNGEKTWCTFAGRADVFILLARTGGLDEGHRGLTLFLVEKPALISTEGHHQFSYKQPEGGRCEGHAIPTLGYRGMHSFAVVFEDYFVPESHRVGEEGKGFFLQMEGFAGGRIQTAARAVGVMEAALRKAVEYSRERQVFGQPLSAFALTSTRLVEMAATIMACRQLSYHVGQLMDDEKGSVEASLVKLLACKQAEWITREAMQLHGGMGYSEEYAVSRYWVDARVLSIFEGAEEVLALYVVARQTLAQHISLNAQT